MANCHFDNACDPNVFENILKMNETAGMPMPKITDFKCCDTDLCNTTNSVKAFNKYIFILFVFFVLNFF